MPSNPEFEIDYSPVADIFASRSIDEIKAAVLAFLKAADEVREAYNGMFVYMLCQRLEESFKEWAARYAEPKKSSAWNAVIVPPEHAPIMLLPSCVPFGGTPAAIIAGMKVFAARCDEFTPPVFDAVTLTEMKRVLTAAQKTYRLLDIIAPKEPMKILCFDNSHTIYNSLCGIPDDTSRTATLFIFHPRENEIYGRVFIFAHELGHALHLALTRNIDVLPDGFAEFNNRLGVKLETTKNKQEAFADSVALAILNAKGLRTHFPSEFSKDMSCNHASYLRGLCTSVLKKSGTLSEPLPAPYSPYDKILREIAARSETAVSDE